MARYIDYMILDDFYTIPGACELLGMEKETLRKKCQKYAIQPTRNAEGQWGFTTYDIRRLHNFLYYEDRPSKEEREEAWR